MYYHSILLNDIINVSPLKEPRPNINYTMYINNLMKELVCNFGVAVGRGHTVRLTLINFTARKKKKRNNNKKKPFRTMQVHLEKDDEFCLNYLRMNQEEDSRSLLRLPKVSPPGGATTSPTAQRIE